MQFVLLPEVAGLRRQAATAYGARRLDEKQLCAEAIEWAWIRRNGWSDRRTQANDLVPVRPQCDRNSALACGRGVAPLRDLRAVAGLRDQRQIAAHASLRGCEPAALLPQASERAASATGR